MTSSADNPPYRVLVLVSHMIPYGSCLLRLLNHNPRLDLLVTYSSIKERKQGPTASLESRYVHHIRWRSHLGDDSLDNLNTLCVGCHIFIQSYSSK